MSSKWSKALACNVYVTAGGQASHRSILQKLLQTAQKVCANYQNDAVVVHAFCDPIYNRSSFHFAGNHSTIITIASATAIGAINELRKLPKSESTSQQQQQHPTIGTVDHIAVFPLTCSPEASLLAGNTARSIGNNLKPLNIELFYYGSADPIHNLPLATVRKQSTAFFSPSEQRRDACTIGASQTFVENFNIRLPKMPRDRARSLTKLIRAREGGLACVEALTLPYQSGWEVACNLLDPERTSAKNVLEVAARWKLRDQTNNHIEKAYRVGTTAKQCLHALEANHKDYDQSVADLFDSYLAGLQDD